jgi:hypothetical protein
MTASVSATPSAEPDQVLIQPEVVQMTGDRSVVPGAFLTSIGVALLLWALIWMAAIGYYPSELPMIVALAAVGGGLAWFGQRMYQAAKRENALKAIERRDADVI